MPDPNLDLARLQFRVHGPLGSPGDVAADQDHIFGAERLGLLQGFVTSFGSKDNLRLSIAIAEIKE
jgi:hypothetical protein